MTDYDEYAKLYGVNWSSLKNLRVSPKHYDYELGATKPDSATFRIGRAIHCALLEPDEFEHRHPVFDGASRRGVKWETFREDHPLAKSTDILIESESDRVRGSLRAVLGDPMAANHFLHHGIPEDSITWNDPDTGIVCKARCDIHNGYLIELKSAADIDPRRFGTQAAQLGYHGQIAFYVDGLRANGKLPDDGPDPVIVAVQSDRPHDVAVYRVPETVVYYGRMLYKRLLDDLVVCMGTGKWPGIARGKEMMLTLPPWAESETFDDEDGRPVTIGGVAIGG